MWDMMTNAPDYTQGFNGAVVRQVRAERAAHGLTIEKLSADSGIPLRTLSRYLSYQRGLTLGHVERLADAFGLSYEELITRARNERHS